MRTTVRAMLAMTLLAGFYVLAFGLVAALAAVDVAIVVTDHVNYGTSKFMAVTLVAVIAILRGVFMVGSRSHRDDDAPDGIVLSPEAQPELWAKVIDVADVVGTRPPDEIRLVTAVNAAVGERTRLLGLISGKRTMIVGAPLVIGLTERELESVLAHELGHYANRDTRLSGITYRGRKAVLHTVSQMQHGHSLDRLVGMLFEKYAKLYIRVSEAVCRRQELAADAAAVRVAGAAATAGALRKIRPLSSAWDAYENRYVTIGVKSGYLPREVMGGFNSFLADPQSQGTLAKMAADAGPEKTSPYDSHPPISQRVALVEKNGDAGSAPDGPERPATVLLRDADRVLETVFTEALNERGRRLTRLEWDDFVHASMRERVAADVRALVDTSRRHAGTWKHDISTVFAALDAGSLVLMAEELGGPLPGDGALAQRENARTRMIAWLTRLTDLALADAGRARWATSWSDLATVVYADGSDAGLTEAIAAAAADTADTEPLRKRLADLGVPEDYFPQNSAPTAVPTDTR